MICLAIVSLLGLALGIYFLVVTIKDQLRTGEVHDEMLRWAEVKSCKDCGAIDNFHYPNCLSGNAGKPL